MEPHPLVSSFTARIQFLGKVSQVVVVVEVAQGNQILEESSKNFSGMKNEKQKRPPVQEETDKGGCSYRAELDAPDTVAQLVQRGRPAHDAHHVGHHQQDASGHARLGREAHLEKAERESRKGETKYYFCGFIPFPITQSHTHVKGKLSGEVVHAAGVHEAERVAHGLRAQHALACDWAEAAIGQCGSHHAGAFAGHLDGAQLAGKGRKNGAGQNIAKSSVIPTIVPRHTIGSSVTTSAIQI